MIWRPSPPSAPGCGGSSRPPASSPWTGSRPTSTTRLTSPLARKRRQPTAGLLTFARASRQRLTIAGTTLTFAVIPPFSAFGRRIVAGERCKKFLTMPLGDSPPALQGSEDDAVAWHRRLRKPSCAHCFFPTGWCHRHLARDRHPVALPGGHLDDAIDQGNRRDAHAIMGAAFSFASL